MASVATCPCCGFDLYALRDFALGPLSVEDGCIVRWQGRTVKLNSSQRLLLLALVRADGAAVRREALADALGYEGEHPHNLVSVHVTRIAQVFRSIDPTFNAIETVWGVGLRWRTEQQHLLAA